MAITAFPYSVLSDIRKTEGVEVAVPSLQRFAKLFHGEGDARTQVFGIDPRIDQQVRDYEISDGTPLKTLNDVVLDASFAKSLKIKGRRHQTSGGWWSERFQGSRICHAPRKHGHLARWRRISGTSGSRKHVRNKVDHRSGAVDCSEGRQCRGRQVRFVEGTSHRRHRTDPAYT